MAEGFARYYGSDVLSAESAGLAPALAVVPMTHHVMMEKGIDLGYCYPKEFSAAGESDLIINMSGYDLPGPPNTPVEVWTVRDPIGESEQVFRQSRDLIEQHVLNLIERLRARKPVGSQTTSAAVGPQAATKVDTRRRPTRK